MRKRNLCILFLPLLLLACRPHGVLSSQKMEDVLVALHLTDGVVQSKDFTYGHDAEVVRMYQATMDELHITQAQFDSSLVWYTDHPQIFNKVYPKVVARLEQQMEAYRAQVSQLNNRKRNNLPSLDAKTAVYQFGLQQTLYRAPDPIPYMIPVE